MHSPRATNGPQYRIRRSIFDTGAETCAQARYEVRSTRTYHERTSSSTTPRLRKITHLRQLATDFTAFLSRFEAKAVKPLKRFKFYKVLLFHSRGNHQARLWTHTTEVTGCRLFVKEVSTTSLVTTHRIDNEQLFRTRPRNIQFSVEQVT
jgi:hypothetical protein